MKIEFTDNENLALMQFPNNHFLSSNCANRVGRALFGAIDFAPVECEPCPCRCVFQLKESCDVTDFLCADPRHQRGVLDRIVHIRASRNHQLDVLDHFLRVLGLPGILQKGKTFSNEF